MRKGIEPICIGPTPGMVETELLLFELNFSASFFELSFDLFREVFDFIRGMIGFTGLSESNVLPVIKTAGVAVITKI